MTIIAIYSPKGGVGKTSLAVNLAWAAATLSSRRTLLWDLDAQGAASFILAPDRAAMQARDVIERDVAPATLIVPTGVPRLDLLPADDSLRTLDALFAQIGAKKRLRRIGELLAKDYDRIIIDCPPGLGPTAEQVIRGADLIVLPAIPSALSARAAGSLVAHLEDPRRKTRPRVMPVFTLVDRRRAGHRAALAAAPAQAVIPMASGVEQMADRHAPVGVYAPRAAVTAAVATLWTQIEAELAANG